MATLEEIRSNKLALWVQQNGPGTAMGLLGLDNSGMDELTEPGPDKTPVIGVDRNGNFVYKTSIRSAPGDFPTTTINVYGKNEINFLRKRFKDQSSFALQRRFNGCLALDNPTGWTWLQHLGLSEINNATSGAGPALPAAGDLMTRGFSIKSERVAELVKGILSNQTSGEAENLTGVVMITDASACPGYRGADKILYATANAGSGVSANVIYSINTGGAWATLGTDPFGADEHANFPVYQFVNETQYRVIVARTVTDGSNPAEVAYNDFTVGAEGTISSWTAVNVGSTNGDVIEAMAWLYYDRLYIATAGDIYVSTDQGASSTSVYTGSNVINAFHLSAVDGGVWAVGASNAILKESNQSGSFATKVGPSGGGAFTAISIASDGTLYAGNGTSIYKSNNGALNTGGWSSLKDFGTSHTVKAIKNIADDPELLYVVVDDATPGVAEFWISVDGGATFEQVTALTNTGYNAAVFSEVDDNFAIMVGDGGTIQKYAPE